MKKILALILAFSILTFPTNIFASLGSHSLDLEQASNQYASRADTASLSITGDLAIEAWVKLESIGAGQEFYVFSKWLGTGNQRAYSFNITDGNTMRLLISQDGSTNDTLAVAWTPSLDTWYHVAVSWDASASTAKFYIDGVQQGSDQTGTRTAILNSSATAYIGASEGTAIADGKTVLVRVWSSERTAANFDDNKCTALGATASLAAEWTLDEVATDNSGNSNDLTLVNTPSYSADIPAECAPAAPTNGAPMMMGSF